MLRKLLIANRGEIAVRIIRTCRSMGIETVAVYSDFDHNALHVRQADEAVLIGPPPPRESYLNIDAIIDAARKTGADAIHPGYGFLSENADFAAACESAGITFIGPTPEVIRAMGSKEKARRIAEQAGVPVVPKPVPGTFPVLIKASAGGGGRGMRIVRDAAELDQSFHAAQGEAERAFGDGTLLLEQYIEGARHVEIQILGDHHGRVIHVFERDCSVQRRHQKLIEESHCTVMTPETRGRMMFAAIALCRKLGYTSAGTVEFLLAPNGDFYFMEVNTRIQVEHPVTEMITGLDLVRQQIEIAEGRALAPDFVPQGYAIEARLYAEDPENDFRPATGRIHVWRPPEHVRVDTAAEPGTEIGVHYDSLLAKVIAYAPDRPTALRKLIYALKHFVVQGVETNREFLIDVLEHEEFQAGRAHTEFRLVPRPRDEHDELLAAMVCGHIERTKQAQRAVLPTIPIGYRNNSYPRPLMRFEIAGREYAVAPKEPGHRVEIMQHGEEYFVSSPTLGQRTVRRLPRYPRPVGAHRHETANSPMPGQVLRILVTKGDRVKAGDPLLVLEAMKMEQTIKTNIDGVVDAILVKTGDIVAPGQMLVEIESSKENNERSSSATTANE
ncbi:MAG TPA: biotin carboxylase N-terminal domain-containing protein [Bryobacteraceae bacterium]|nr:biotin carboxylase N-terminal domain-containing protein [Bryobacteraceae bacterium]